MATTVTFTYGANALTITGDGVFDGPTYDRLEGWIGVDADLRFQPRPSAPGAFAPQQVYARDRLISLEGQYFGSSRADAIAMRERLLGLQNDGRPLTMTVADDLRTTSREVYVEQITVPWTIHQEFRYAVDVRAADPRRYAPAATATTGPALSSGGLSLPIAFPVDFGVAGDDGRLTAVNVGNTATGQRFTVSGGGMPDGFDIVNTTTGQRIRYLGPVSSELIGTELIATNLATNPSFETGSGTVEVRRNLAVNPSFETNTTSWNNWATVGAVTYSSARQTSGGFFGSAFFRGTATATGSGGFSVAATVPDSPDYTAGQVVTHSLYVRSSIAINARVQIDFFIKASTTFVSTVASSVISLAPNVWTRVSVTATVPETATTGRVTFRSDSSAVAITSGDTFDIDAYLAEISPTLNPYFDGSTPAGGDFTYAWTGTANASASVQNGVGVAGVGTFGAAVYQSSEWSRTGARSLRITPGPGATGAQTATITERPTTVGVTYTALATIRLSSALSGSTDVASRRLQAWTAGFGALVAQSDAAPNAAGETVLRVTFTASTATTDFALRNGASQGNGDVWWDDFMLVEGTYTGDYFDGSTPDTYRTVYSWSGAPDASTSTATRQIYSESFVVVDTRLRTALINGTAPAARFLASPEWWEIPAGSSVDIQFVPRGPTTGSPILTAETASAFY